MKLSALDIDLTRVWALEIAAQLDEDFQQGLQRRLESLNIRPKSRLEPMEEGA